MAEVANEGLDQGVGVARMDLLHSISHHIYRGSKVSMRDIIFGEGEGRAAGAMLDTACVDLSNSVPNYPASHSFPLTRYPGPSMGFVSLWPVAGRAMPPSPWPCSCCASTAGAVGNVVSSRGPQQGGGLGGATHVGLNPSLATLPICHPSNQAHSSRGPFGRVDCNSKEGTQCVNGLACAGALSAGRAVHVIRFCTY